MSQVDLPIAWEIFLKSDVSTQPDAIMFALVVASLSISQIIDRTWLGVLNRKPGKALARE
jgi:hypothetical protein